MRGKIGTKAEEFDPAKEEITAHFKKIDERLNDLTNAVNAAVRRPRPTERRGPSWKNQAERPEGDRLVSQRAQQDLYLVARPLTELMENLSLLTTELSLNYVNVQAEPRVGHQRRQAAGRRSDQGRRPTARPTSWPNRRSTRTSAAPS